MGKEAVLVGWGKFGGKLADALAGIPHVTHVGTVCHMETFRRMNSNVAKAVEDGLYVPVVKRDDVLRCQTVMETALKLRGAVLKQPFIVFQELYDPNSVVYEALRAENSRKMIERWKDDKFRAKVIKGMVRAWKLHYLIAAF